MLVINSPKDYLIMRLKQEEDRDYDDPYPYPRCVCPKCGSFDIKHTRELTWYCPTGAEVLCWNCSDMTEGAEIDYQTNPRHHEELLWMRLGYEFGHTLFRRGCSISIDKLMSETDDETYSAGNLLDSDPTLKDIEDELKGMKR